ncbi:MAG: septum site-determining protein MinC [Methyloceanibacter sp.]|uniref:septum site-determining protein MinC n=1 Tax=Methyloceanibacter sp. TaxID=1965321 RepID=UPI003D6C85C9
MAVAALKQPTTEKQPARSFQFHGRTFLTFVLQPEMPLGRWLSEADTWLARSPDFFAAKPVVIDVSRLLLTKAKLAKLIADLGSRGIRVMGLLGADPAWADSDLPPVLSANRMAELGTPRDMSQPVAPAPELAKPAPKPLVIDAPVRSGQTLFHDGDLTIIGSVSSGAEIVATGSIHIYGALRGRVLAGADGNKAAHIFCRRFAAELVAIDGFYRMAEDIELSLLERPVHAWLEDGALNIKALD